jgi:hypothetical protein
VLKLEADSAVGRRWEADPGVVITFVADSPRILEISPRGLKRFQCRSSFALCSLLPTLRNLRLVTHLSWCSVALEHMR